MTKADEREQEWETPSLEWIHRIRRERQQERGARRPRPLPRNKAEKLAEEYGLRIVRPVPAGR
jgi:hypothetical protein